jgi:hypothetical protein
MRFDVEAVAAIRANYEVQNFNRIICMNHKKLKCVFSTKKYFKAIFNRLPILIFSNNEDNSLNQIKIIN